MVTGYCARFGANGWASESAAREPYYGMAHLRAPSINAHCDRQRLSSHERLQLFLKICDTVQYAHTQFILHRDIKPGNLIVDALGAPKLIDVGIAKQIR